MMQMIPLQNEDETFLDIEDFEGMYSVSNFGRVYSHKGKGKFLKGFPTQDGYLRVDLCKDGKGKSICIHVLVGNAFVGKRENGLTFDHIDRNNQNNRADNIRLATKSEQQINQKLRCNNKLGERNIHINGNRYVIQIRRNGKIVINFSYLMKKYTLDDVVKERNEILSTI